MENNNDKLSYRPISDGDSSAWYYAGGINEMTSTGCYILKFNHENTDVGLPMFVCEESHYINSVLIVTESGAEDNLQKNRLVGQTLILPQCYDGKTHLYTRTLKCADNLWQPWARIQQNIEVGQVTSLDTYIDGGVYSGTYTYDSLCETFVMFVIDNKPAASANGNVRSVSQFKYSLNLYGTFSYRVRTGLGDAEISWGEWVDIGAADTTDIQDNSITAMKLSVDVRENMADVTEIKNKALQTDTVHITAGIDKINLGGRSVDGANTMSANIPAATTERAGVMTAEDKMKLEENNLVVSNIAVSGTNIYSGSMEWELTYNNKESADYYVTAVKNADGSVTLIPSQGGKNLTIATYIGTPIEGEIIQVSIDGIYNVEHIFVHTGVTSTNYGTVVIELVENNGIYTAKFKSDGKPIYLRMTIPWSANPNSPAVIGSCHINGTIVEFIEDFVTKEDLVAENLAIIPKAEKYYNPSDGTLGISASRFGTGLIKVAAGLVLRSNAPKDYYIVKFDSNKNYIGYNRPNYDYLCFGYFEVPVGTEFIAITSLGEDFDYIILSKVNTLITSIIPLEYDTDRVTTRAKVSKFLRRSGIIIAFVENGKSIIEVFHNSEDRENLSTNYFQVDKNWKEVAYSDIINGLSPHPMKGKTFYSIGDSHRWKWLGKLSEITGATSGGDIFDKALAANEKFYVSRVVSMAKYIVDLYKAGKPVDYIFLEYVHKYFTNDLSPSDAYHYSGDITEAEPFLTQAYYDYTARTFNNTSEASAFWNENFTDIVSLFTPKSTSIIALKTGVKMQTPKFKLLSDTTTAGNFTIKFTDNNGNLYQMAMAITAGLTINEALTLVNEIEFADSGCKWDNLNAHNTITDASLKFTYVGDLNDSDAGIKMSFDFGTTGITYDGDWSIATETKDWIRGFKSHDVSAWSDASKWHDLNANMDAYIWIKAAVELLQREIPTAKIFVWTLCTESWNYTDNTIEGKSVLYPDGTLNVQAIYDSTRHKRMVQNVEGWENVAKYYHLGFIPISEINNISPANHKYYYASDDVHPTQEGYDRVAEILAKNIN